MIFKTFQKNTRRSEFFNFQSYSIFIRRNCSVVRVKLLKNLAEINENIEFCTRTSYGKNRNRHVSPREEEKKKFSKIKCNQNLSKDSITILNRIKRNVTFPQSFLVVLYMCKTVSASKGTANCSSKGSTCNSISFCVV